MYTRGRTLRFTAVSAMVVLALTGFSSGHGHRSRSHHSGGGGGCSSSAQDHDSSSSSSGGSGGGSYDSSTYDSDEHGSGTSTGGGTYRARPTHRSTPTASSSGTAQPPKDGTAVLKRCASSRDPFATVEVRNPNGREATFTVRVTFKDVGGYVVARTTDQVLVSAKDRATLRVPVAGTGRVIDIDHCEVDPRATADR